MHLYIQSYKQISLHDNIYAWTLLVGIDIHIMFSLDRKKQWE